MDQPSKLPPKQVNALAERLQTSLQRRRPRTWFIVASVLALALVGLSLLAWWLYDLPAPPRLEVVAFDALFAPTDTPEVSAQFAFPDQGEHSPIYLRNREVLFFNSRALAQPGQQEPQAFTVTDDNGRAVILWTPPDPARGDAVLARYIDARNKQGSADQARLVRWEHGSKILLVDVEETLAQIEPAEWLTRHVADIPVRPHAAQALQAAQRKQYHIAYLAVTATDPLAYRKLRGWVHAAPRPEKDRFPPGPVLGRRGFPSSIDTDEARRERVDELKRGFGDNITLVTRTARAAGASTAGGVRVIVLDPEVDLPGAIRVPGWAEVLPLLDIPAKNNP